jgi:hypothetical protein
MKNGSQSFTPVIFTSTVDERLKKTVSGIAAQHDGFATDLIGLKGDEGHIIMGIYLAAWQDASTKLWGIDRYTYVPALDTIEKKVEAMPGLCFFDALYHCARFQATELSMNGKTIIGDVSDYTDAVHFSIAADKAGQVIDQDGKVHPCAFGRILTEGSFTRDQIQCARITKKAEMVIVNQPGRPLVRDLLDSLLTSQKENTAGNTDLIVGYDNRRTLANNFRQARKNGDILLQRIGTCIEHEFKAGSKYTSDSDCPKWFKTVITLGINPVIQFSQGNPDYNLVTAFKFASYRFKKSVEALPDCQEKELVREFAHAANAAFWLERAARVYQNNHAKLDKSSRPIRNATRFIDSAGSIMGLEAVDISRLKAEYLEGKFEIGKFYTTLKNKWHNPRPTVNFDQIVPKLMKKIAAIEAGLS